MCNEADRQLLGETMFLQVDSQLFLENQREFNAFAGSPQHCATNSERTDYLVSKFNLWMN